MTIHQSKGLEFDIVVLPELDVPFFRGGGEEALPFRETPTGPYTRVFPYAPSGIRPLFPEIEEAYRQHRAAVLRDGLSALYVAMTRARHELHIILKPDGKSGPGTAMTPARIVREALAPGAPAHPDDVLFESGDPGWKKAKAQAKAEGVVERGESVVEGEVVGEGEVVRGIAAPGRSAPLLRAQPRRLRLLPHRAPSGLGRGTRVDLAERLRIDTAPSLERGSVIHAWCERIEWLDDARPAAVSRKRRRCGETPNASRRGCRPARSTS